MISAKIIKDSISPAGKRITTFELEYPRFIHAELLTHRVFSKNSASSRAIPVKDMLKLVWNNPAMPVHWGKYQSGMTAKEEVTGWRLWLSKKLWVFFSKVSCVCAWTLWKTGLAKQLVNRLVEWCGHIKVVLTSTEWDNWYNLRWHPDAQPEICALAESMLIEHNASTPTKLGLDDWHLPYIYTYVGEHNGNIIKFYSTDYDMSDEGPDDIFDLDTAKKISASLCAQTSYRKSDDSVDKAIKLYDRLVTSKPVHASPFEHQAKPLEDPKAMSGNFFGWFQHRKEIKDNVCTKFERNGRTI